MRRRLTIAILGVVIGTLVLSVAGGLFLVRRSSISTAESEMTGQAQALGNLLSTRANVTTDQTLIRVLKNVGSYQYLAPVGLSSSGVFESLPSPLTPPVMDVSALESGQTVTGNVGSTVFAAVPISLSARERGRQGIPVGDLPVLIVTKQVTNPVNPLPYFLLVAGVVLVIGALVAAFLARRISAPLVRAVGATRRIAAGDLEARVPTDQREPNEIADLGRAINSLGDSLSRSRGLERQFLMSVSHELRTPLTSIRGYADAVAEGAADDVVAAAGVIGSEARRLERLVQDLLDLARLDARQFSLHVQRVDLATIAEGVASGFRPEATSLGLRLVEAVEPGTETWVDADPDRLAQVVANLVENAFKFATSQVEIGAAVVPVVPVVGGVPAGSVAVLWVGDDGPGIRPEDLPHVFDRHFRSDRVPARRAGTGLGLAIVAELAAAMGATVRADSPLPGGRGTRMTLSMPLAGMAEVPGSPWPPPANANGAPSAAATPAGATRADTPTRTSTHGAPTVPASPSPMVPPPSRPSPPPPPPLPHR